MKSSITLIRFFILITLPAIILISCKPDSNGNGPTDSEPTLYDVSVTVSPDGAGTISPSVDSTYQENETVNLQAQPNSEYIFTGWSGSVESTENPLAISIDKTYGLTAHFEPKSYNLAVTTEGKGGVSEEIIEQNAKEYDHGTVVELTAIPDANWVFKEWQGAVTGSKNPRQIIINQAKQVTAVFEQRAYPLDVTIQGKGGVNEKIVQAKVYESGTMVELSAYPAIGWKFKEWQGDVTGSQNSVRLTVDNAKEVIATFERKSYTMDIAITGNGSVSIAPDQVEYRYGEPVELTATPDVNWKFVEWAGDTTATENPLTVAVDSTMNITAEFIKSFYLAANNVTIKCGPADVGDTGTIDGVTYTKRTAGQITPSNAPTTCTSGITHMNNLFYNALSFNGNINHWDVSNVTNMLSMFSYAMDFNRDLNSWDVSNVTTMTGMFHGASSFNGDITGWEVTNVEYMRNMFLYARAFNQDVGGWKVGSVTNMKIMFKDAENFDQDLSGWCVSGNPDHQGFATGAGFDPNDGTNDTIDADKQPQWGEPCPSN